jgi:type I restriction enzyme S subunit
LLKEEISVPSIALQERIELLLEQEFSVAQSVAREISLLREYRSRLTADVVTGKLDVRNVAASLTDEVLIENIYQEDQGSESDSLDMEDDE